VATWLRPSRISGTALAPALIGGAAAVFDWRVALAVAAAVGIVYTAAFLVLFTDVEPGDSRRPVTDGGGTDGLRSRLAGTLAVPLEWWVVLLFLANLAIATQIGAARTFTTSYLVDEAGLSTSLANGVFFAMLVGAGLSSLGGGTLADAVDRRWLGFGLMALAMVAFATTAVIPPVPVVLGVWFFVLGAILWAAVPTMNAITSSYSERAFSGSLFGVMLTAGSIGGAGGPLAFGLAAEAYGLRAAFPVVASVSVVGGIAFLLVGRVGKT
jgi:predicted MFS family arabinose efflux permease